MSWVAKDYWQTNFWCDGCKCHIWECSSKIYYTNGYRIMCPECYLHPDQQYQQSRQPPLRRDRSTIKPETKKRQNRRAKERAKKRAQEWAGALAKSRTD